MQLACALHKHTLSQCTRWEIAMLQIRDCCDAVTLTTRRANHKIGITIICKTPNAANHKRFCPCDCTCSETHPRKLRKITNKNHGNCEHDKTRCLHTSTHVQHWTLESSHKNRPSPHHLGWKFRAAQNAVLQTKLQTMLQTNNAGNQTHTALTLFSATSSAPHTSSSKSPNLSPPSQDFPS